LPNNSMQDIIVPNLKIMLILGYDLPPIWLNLP